MKLSRIKIQNVKSFHDEVEISFYDDSNILIGSNGSGKSNLLDIITIGTKYFFLKPFNVVKYNDGLKEVEQIQQSYIFQEINKDLEKYFNNPEDSLLEFEFILKQEDIDNIKNIQNNYDNIKKGLEYFKDSSDFDYVFETIKNEWDWTVLKPEKKIIYSISNNKIQNEEQTDSHKIFLQYLNYFELFLIALKDSDNKDIKTNYLFFSPFRGVSSSNLQANISEQSFFQVLSSVTDSTSKSVSSLINLATIYFAEKMRGFEVNAQKEGYESLWEADNEVMLVKKYLKKLGYDWHLKLIDKNKNIYEIVLLKGNTEFQINQASSGEKEIINFLFGIFAFNIKNGIIVIDEPELHLHPRWQLVLLDLFEELSKETKNQFIISTHSPTFINEQSYKHLIRIYKDENNYSKSIVLKDTDSLRLKDIFHIINSTNNEKIFFADVVIFVEGITDRLVFQRILEEKTAQNDLKKIVEIIEIKGKNNFNKFSEFLDALEIPNYFISDLDYINEVGTSNIQSIFTVNDKKIEKDVIKNNKSNDQKSLFESIESTIETSNFDDLKEIWDYIKSFRRKKKTNLTQEEESKLSDFIEERKSSNNYILTRGDIEDYFPEELKAKDITNVISLLDEKYDSWKSSDEFQELEQIIADILKAENIN